MEIDSLYNYRMCSNEISYFQYFKEAILFFKEMQWLYNMPVTKILFTGSLNLFPIEWLETLKKLDNTELNNFVVKKEICSHWPESLINFVQYCCKFNRLPNTTVLLSPVKLPQAFTSKISLKKQHEIIHLAQLVHEQCQLKDISLIIDVGAGLGYICQLLNFLYGYKVLGLESNSQNVETANLRQRTTFPDSLPSVKYVCYNINTNAPRNIELIVEKEFGEIENVCLISLHACGDLSAYTSQIYLEVKMVHLLILVSCCYHKLTLKKTEDKIEESDKKEYFNYFPLSKKFKQAIDSVDVDIGKFFKRPFLRLACQETSDRWLTMSAEAHNEHSFYVLARAVLELYGAKNNLYLKKLVQKGTRKSQCSSFENYLEDCVNRYKYIKNIICDNKLKECEISWNDKIKNEITLLWENNLEKQRDVELYTALQLILQHAAESLVLVDRLCFLNEHNFEANIIPIMERSLSPRSYALVSKKNLNS